MREDRAIVLRAVGIVGLLGIALVHLLDVVDKMEETPYIGWMYIALMIVAVVVAGVLLVEGSARAWAAAGLLAASVLVGFILSRTSGLPDATGDTGNWSEALGLASMFVEAVVIAASGVALATLGGLHAVRESLPHRAPHPAH